MELPSPIVIDILSRLPPQDIARCRCVCKTLNHLTSDPEFVNLHFSRSPPCFLLNNVYSPPEAASFSLVEFDDDPDHRHDLRRIPGIRLELPKASPDAKMNVVGVINGLVCVCESTRPRNTLYIWNPTMGEFVTFQAPEPPEESQHNLASYGFGLSVKKGEYKVAQIIQELGIEYYQRKSECHVYTLGTGSWRSISNVPSIGYCTGHAVYLGGNLHWVTEDGSDVLYRLDLEKEILEPFPSPQLNDDYRKVTLNLYNGRLCVNDNTEEFDVKVWVMREYGVGQSWVKLLEITEDPVGSFGNYFDGGYFVRVYGDGEILIILGTIILFFRHPNGGTWEVDARELVMPCKTRFRYHDTLPMFEAVQFVPSFFPLKNLGEHVVKINIDYHQKCPRCDAEDSCMP